jgi:MDMPI C-terminal domain
VDVLTATPADSPAWTFSSLGERRAGWWRRLAVELAIHRWDAQHAAADRTALPRPVHGDVAVAGIQEFLTEFLPGLLAQPGVTGLAGTLHLHATDEPGQRQANLGTGTADNADTRPAHTDTTVQGTRSDLLLWLTNRGPLPAIKITGRESTAAAWTQLRR